MEHSLGSIHVLVTKLKQNMFSKTKGDNNNVYSFVSPSTYDTAWLAMIPHPLKHNTPLFKGCLEWILSNQNEEGYWGTSVKGGDRPIVDDLPATLVCMVVLRKWGLGVDNIEKGLKFLNANMEEMLRDNRDHFPRWFSLVFPATIELAESSGLQLMVSGHMKSLISEICESRQQVLRMEETVDKWHHPPLLAYLEAFQSTNCNVDQETITKHLSEDGSLFQSPSATAQAYISTGNLKCLEYLISLVQTCPNGVPQKYPMDVDLVELSMVDQVHKLGLSEYFEEEIENTLTKVYRSYKEQEHSLQDNMKFVAEKLYKDSLAFRLFRLHGFNISPRTFCWFLYDDELLDHLEINCGQFTSVLYCVYKATDLMLSGENEIEEARSFSRKLLQKTSTMNSIVDDDVVILPNLSRVIGEELRMPWIARLDHLDHWMWIENNKEGPLWTGKTSFYRLSCVHNMELMQLAVENYAFRQFIYQNELKELKRWSEEWGLTEMGFGREKTMYCYFAIAASTSLPHDSIIRMLVAKSAILITVADDFFDMQGNLQELHLLIEAIHRWDGDGLRGPSKVIFDVLDDLVRDSTRTLVLDGKIDMTEEFRDLWRETFDSWLTETTWGKSGYIPSVNEYLETGMISIATHILVLIPSCFMNPSLPKSKVKPQKYESITQALMATTRLLNDVQSYEKEQEEGKMNLVLLHFKENPDASMDDSIAAVQKILDGKRKELMKHIFTDADNNDFPNHWKKLHLSCFKVFQMLFNSANLYDTETELRSDIEKAIYIPPQYEPLKHVKPQTTLDPLPRKRNLMISTVHTQTPFRHYGFGHMKIKACELNMRNVSSFYFNKPKLSLSLV
uniref:ent-kaurene synthase n=1 Tax=Grindelia hirsutula TaxID=1114741 RepID=R9UNP3_9ASTR|nr:geranyllinalool synthase [Grindelia hirsutula]